jgi:hypothetical protein
VSFRFRVRAFRREIPIKEEEVDECFLMFTVKEKEIYVNLQFCRLATDPTVEYCLAGTRLAI